MPIPLNAGGRNSHRVVVRKSPAADPEIQCEGRKLGSGEVTDGILATAHSVHYDGTKNPDGGLTSPFA